MRLVECFGIGWLVATLCIAPSAAGQAPAASGLAAVNDGVFWGRSVEGWFWYQDPRERPPQVPPPPRQPEATPAEVRELKALQRRLEETRAVAVMNPTEANVRAYLVAQQEAYGRSAKFADVWRRVVWTDPGLDYSQRGRPSNNVAMRAWDQEQNTKKEEWVASLARTHGLFFFFRGDCPYCHAAAPVLADFSRRYGIQVFPISLDGSVLPEFPDAVRDAGQARSLGVETVPALFLARPGTKEIQPIGHGVLAVSDILDRIWVLTKTKPGESF